MTWGQRRSRAASSRFRARKAPARSRVAGNRPRRANPSRLDRHRNVPIRYPLTTKKRAKRRTTRSLLGRHRGHRIRAACRGVRTKLPSSPKPPGRERRRRWPARGTRGVLWCTSRNHGKIYCIGFSPDNGSLFGSINGHFARLSLAAAKKRSGKDRAIDRSDPGFRKPSLVGKSEKIPIEPTRVAFSARHKKVAASAPSSGRRLKKREQARDLHTTRWRRKPRKATWRTSQSTPRKSWSRNS